MFHPRAEERVREQAHALVRPMAEGGAVTAPAADTLCTVVNFSVAGARLSSHDRMQVGTRLSLHITFRGPAARFQFTGTVTWVESAGRERFVWGVALDPLPEGERGTWTAFVAARLAAQRQAPPDFGP